MKRKAATTIHEAAAGVTVLDYLTQRFSYHCREEWQAAIAERKVFLNSLPAEETIPLQLGDHLEYLCDLHHEPPVDRDYSIIFEDEYLLAVNKPGNLPCHPAGRFFNHTLWAMLIKQYNPHYLAFVNRLDRETSGIVLLAKSAVTAQRCQALFQLSEVYKRYIVLIEGNFPETLEGHGFLCPDISSDIRKKQRFWPLDTTKHLPTGAREVKTTFRHLRSSEKISQVEAIPVTGRHHQIRATLHSLGYPVVGDKIYGVDERIFLRFIRDTLTQSDRDKMRMERQALHAAQLCFKHPHTGRELNLEADLPADMVAVTK